MSDFRLEEVGRLTEPMHWDLVSDRVSIAPSFARSVLLEASCMYQLLARIYGNNNMHRMIADHGSVNEQAAALAKTLKITPEDNPTSKSLKDAQDANRTKLDALSGAAFDKAYADNEAAYHKSVDDALSNTLIPDAQNAELKSLLENGLKIFQDHQRDAENIVKQLSVAHQ